MFKHLMFALAAASFAGTAAAQYAFDDPYWKQHLAKQPSSVTAQSFTGTAFSGGGGESPYAQVDNYNP